MASNQNEPQRARNASTKTENDQTKKYDHLLDERRAYSVYHLCYYDQSGPKYKQNRDILTTKKSATVTSDEVKVDQDEENVYLDVEVMKGQITIPKEGYSAEILSDKEMICAGGGCSESNKEAFLIPTDACCKKAEDVPAVKVMSNGACKTPNERKDVRSNATKTRLIGPNKKAEDVPAVKVMSNGACKALSQRKDIRSNATKVRLIGLNIRDETSEASMNKGALIKGSNDAQASKTARKLSNKKAIESNHGDDGQISVDRSMYAVERCEGDMNQNEFNVSRQVNVSRNAGVVRNTRAEWDMKRDMYSIEVNGRIDEPSKVFDPGGKHDVVRKEMNGQPSSTRLMELESSKVRRISNTSQNEDMLMLREPRCVYSKAEKAEFRQRKRVKMTENDADRRLNANAASKEDDGIPEILAIKCEQIDVKDIKEWVKKSLFTEIMYDEAGQPLDGHNKSIEKNDTDEMNGKILNADVYAFEKELEEAIDNVLRVTQMDQPTILSNVRKEYTRDKDEIRPQTRLLLHKMYRSYSYKRDKCIDLMVPIDLNWYSHVERSELEKRNRISELLRDSSTKTGDKKMINLNEYVERTNDDQRTIYCIIWESKAGVEPSPFLEALKQRNLYLFGRQCDEKHVKSVDKTMNLAQRLAWCNLDNKKVVELNIKPVLQHRKPCVSNRNKEIEAPIHGKQFFTEDDGYRGLEFGLVRFELKTRKDVIKSSESQDYKKELITSKGTVFERKNKCIASEKNMGSQYVYLYVEPDEPSIMDIAYASGARDMRSVHEVVDHEQRQSIKMLVICVCVCILSAIWCFCWTQRGTTQYMDFDEKEAERGEINALQYAVHVKTNVNKCNVNKTEYCAGNITKKHCERVRNQHGKEAGNNCDTISIHFDIKNHQAIDAIAPISAIDTNEANSRHNITDNPTQNRALQTNIVWNDEDSMTKVISQVVRGVAKTDSELLINGFCNTYNDSLDQEPDVQSLSEGLEEVTYQFVGFNVEEEDTDSGYEVAEDARIYEPGGKVYAMHELSCRIVDVLQMKHLHEPANNKEDNYARQATKKSKEDTELWQALQDNYSDWIDAVSTTATHDDIQIYKEDVHKALVSEAKQYYKQKSRFWLDQQPRPEYLIQAEKCVQDEEGR
eukprot:903840_1